MRENHAKIWGKKIPSRGIIKCKGPRLELAWIFKESQVSQCSRRSVSEERVVGDKIGGMGETQENLSNMISSLDLF